jgi:hypothetical protein
MSGCTCFSSSIAARTPSATSTSPAPSARDLEAHHRLAVEQRSRAPFGDAVGDAGHLVEPHVAAVGQGDVERAELGRGGHGGDRSHRLFGAAEVDSAARRLLLHRAQLARDVGGGHAQREQARRVELDPHLARDAADAVDAAHAAHREQALGDLVVDEPRQRLVVHARGRDGVGQDRHRREVHLRDHRVAQLRGQIRADARDRVAHVVHRLLRRLLEAELGSDAGAAVLDLGVQVLQPLYRRQRVFDLARDLGLHLRRRGTGQRRRDGDRRQVDVRKVLDLHRAKAHHADDRQHDEQQHRRHRRADRPGGDVDVHRGFTSRRRQRRRCAPCRRRQGSRRLRRRRACPRPGRS